MRLIEKIKIHRFRSISDVDIDTEEITIFSGLNNSGKSNILRALNLFFTGESSFGQKYDFEKDYNKAFTGQAGGKRAIKIELHFKNQGTAALKGSFSISRTFQAGKDVELEYHSEDPDIQKSIDDKDGNITRQFTRFLNKIEYIYIPAVREKRFVRNLFLHFEKLIEHDSGSDFKDKVDELSNILEKNSRDISTDFENFIGLPTRAELSSKITDILGTVEVNVQTGIKVLRRKKSGTRLEDVYVNLFSSGDGILMSYLAYFLAHICKKISNKLFIWGFEEPENSLEYSKVQKIAGTFFSEFKKNAQIFITTHSPAFMKLKDRSGVGFFRVYIDSKDETNMPDKKNKNPVSKIRTLYEIKTVQQTLFEMGDTASSEYNKLTEELHCVEFANEIEDAVKRVEEEAKKLSEERREYEKKHKKALSLQPPNIFICEDSDKKVCKLWRKWLKTVGIRGVEVMSSEGSTQNHIENWVRCQQKLDSAYQPKLFRQIDRDGLTDEQIKVIEDEIFKKEKGFSYKYKFLPVNEIENIAILADKSKFPDKLWEKNKDAIVKSFELTVADKLKIFDKKFDFKQKAFRDSSGNYISIMQKMREAAQKNWRGLFPGKDICQKVQNYNSIKYLLTLKKRKWPHELTKYMNTIKTFYNIQEVDGEKEC